MQTKRFFFEISDNLFAAPAKGQAFGAPEFDARIEIAVDEDNQWQMKTVALRHELVRDDYGVAVVDADGEAVFDWYPLDPVRDNRLWCSIFEYLLLDPNRKFQRALNSALKDLDRARLYGVAA